MILLESRVVDGIGTIAKCIVINTAEDYKNFQALVQRGANLWPDAPASIKIIADLITNGQVMQEYRDIPARNSINPGDNNV